MICSSCRRTLVARLRPQIRHLTVPATTSAAPSNPPATNSPTTSSATPGISQPLSTPSFPSTKPGRDIKKAKITSSVAGGSELKGLAYLKNVPRVIAKEDEDYPEWLWTILGDNTQGDGKPTVDVAALTKKQRAKYERKQAKLLKDVPKPIPLHEQSKDLTDPGADAIASLQKRQELTKSSRDARRKEIRETNFLKGM